MADIKIYGTLIRDVDYNTPDKIVRGYQVAGGYFVCETLPKWGDVGQLCYCSTDKKFYQYLPVTEEKDGSTIIVNKWVNVRLNDVAERLDAEIARAISAEAKLSDTIKSEGIRITEDLTSIREEANKEAYKVSTLIGGQQDEDKSVRTIANEELAAQLLSDNADASFKTLQELATWIENHPEDVAAINAAIQQLEKDLAKEKQRSKKKDDELLAKIDEETERAVFEEQRLTERADKADRRLVEHDEQFATLNQMLAEEIERAGSAESGLADDLKSESLRATEAEKELLEALGITQQLVEENKQSIAEENVRARTAEAFVSEKVDTEAERAILAEDRIRNSLIAEEQRALEAEELLREDLKNNFGEINTLLEEEVNRATKAETDLDTALKEYINNLLFDSEFVIDCTGIGEPQ